MNWFCETSFWEVPVLEQSQYLSVSQPNDSSSTSNTILSGNSSSTVPPLDDIPPCIQNTVLVWIPCGYLFLIAPLYLFYLTRCKERNPINHTWLNITKSVLCLLLVGLSLMEVIYLSVQLYNGVPVSPAKLHTPILRTLATLLMTAVNEWERLRAVRSSAVCFVYWLLHVIAAIFVLQSRIRAVLLVPQAPWSDVFLTCTFSLITSLMLAELVLSLLVDEWPYNSVEAKDPNVSPELSASFLSSLVWFWITGLIIKGYKQPLEMSDLHTLSTENQTATIVPKFERELEKEIAKCKKEIKKLNPEKPRIQIGKHNTYNDNDNDTMIPLRNKDNMETDTIIVDGKKKEPGLVSALFHTFWSRILLTSLVKLIFDIFTFVNPQLLKALIRFCGDPESPMWHGYVYALLMFGTIVIHSVLGHHNYHISIILGMRIRSALILTIYKKALRLSSKARKGSTTGEITNLMAVDAQRFMDACVPLNALWSSPLLIGFALYFLWMMLGPSVLAGLCVMVLLIPINAVITRKVRALQIEGMEHKDSRLKLMSEILNGMKVLKLYAWEKSFEKKVLDVRNSELQVLQSTAYFNAITSFAWHCAPVLVTSTTFAVYVLSSPDNVLDAEKAFVSLSLFFILRDPLVHIPNIIITLVQVSVSANRLRKFLALEELDPTMVNKSRKSDDVISIQNASFTWEDQSEPTLKNINLKVSAGSLIAVVGNVGSGKSSFLSCMLGEMEKIKGNVTIKGNIAYASQQAWLRNATVKDNILFGTEEDSLLYHEVINSCALEKDLELLPAADMTEIGEKGVHLSGGQKQRVSLARAVYQDAPIYFLDDPLSAVDAHVGKHIFDKVLGPQGLLKMKTRILVTNAVHYLPQVDHIVVLDDGCISETGTYSELLSARGSFSQFLKNHLLNEEPENYEEEDDDQKKVIISHISPLIEEEFPALKKLDCSTFKKFEMARQISRETSCPSSPEPCSPLKIEFTQETSGISLYSRQTSRTTKRSRTVSGCTLSAADEEDVNDNDMFSAYDERRDDGSEWLRGARRQVKLVNADDKPPPATVTHKEKEVDKLIKDEETETGKVKLSVFVTYARYIGFPVTLGYIFLQMLFVCTDIGADFWLSDWSNDASRATHWNNSINMGNNSYVNAAENATTDGSIFEQRNIRLMVYGALGIFQGLSMMLSALVFASGRVHAARQLHYDMLHNILRCPLHFFDSNPLGRITNRFSKDIDHVDHGVPNTLGGWIHCLLISVSFIVVITVNSPYILLVIMPLAVFSLLLQRIFVATSRQLKRLESTTKSPVYSHFGETLQGVMTIRAYDRQEQFIEQAQQQIDDNNKTFYPNITAILWMSLLLQNLGSIIVLFTTVFMVMARDHLDAGTIGLTVTYALGVTGVLNGLIRLNSEVEIQIVAVERIKEYAEMSREAEWDIPAKQPSADWPSKGEMTIDTYATRYRPGLDLVLKGVTCAIKGGEKVGIVGRTGAGKSSLTLALFRIIEAAEGSITIDGISLADIGLYDLRTKLTIIPQDPVLFSGTLRMNLDPISAHTDEQLWTAIELAHLSKFIKSHPEGLELECSEGGENLSVGQRQLLCLARALLRKTRVLILDEATAAVDMETDSLIQATIRREFEECTVITIAHRLNTIIDYSRIIVLDAGVLAEYDTPENLLANKDSIFYGMAKDAGLTQ